MDIMYQTEYKEIYCTRYVFTQKRINQLPSLIMNNCHLRFNSLTLFETWINETWQIYVLWWTGKRRHCLYALFNLLNPRKQVLGKLHTKKWESFGKYAQLTWISKHFWIYAQNIDNFGAFSELLWKTKKLFRLFFFRNAYRIYFIWNVF